MSYLVTAKALSWCEPEADELGQEDMALIANGIGGKYSIEAPRLVADNLLPGIDRTKCVEIEGKLHFKALLWWAHDEFSFTEFDSVEAAKLGAEADWQERFRALVAFPMVREEDA